MSPASPKPQKTSAQEELKQTLLKVLTDKGEEVEKVVITEPSELKGEHMATATVYATVTFKDQTKTQKNLFVKTFTDNPAHRQMFKQMKVMEKESSFFTEFLPSVSQFCKDTLGLDNFLGFFPECLYGNKDMLILDNVVVNDNYKMVPKEERQDFETAMIVLENLAKFHAATYALITTMGKPQFMQKWELNIFEGFASENNPFVDTMFAQAVRTCISILRMHRGSLKEADYAIGKLESYLPQSGYLMQQLYKEGPYDTFVSVNHGDCWNNNMLFKKDPTTGKVTDHIFVDLQMTRIGPPTLDIGYYLFTSVQPSVRRGRFQELMEQYYGVYKTTVESFQLSCPVTFQEFMLSFKKNCSAGFLINLSMLSSLAAMKNYDMKTTEVFSVEEAKIRFRKLVADWIQNNPDKTGEIANQLVDVIKDYEEFKL